ncbi:DUF58 domain-containing protein [Thiorhodospira sibirica]|uniref:DUF58 domain-containing protein n=1 Tax=Thiorhodospira sibirica TaxID=154347 RepID=UPI0002F39E1B|nr:DUF58 domain-containing protein [Thiorhodospira sibirica]
MEQWIIRRQGSAARELRVHRRVLYILPTRHGMLFALILVLMLLGSINYSNSMAFLLTFLLAGLGSNAMWHTHRNVVDVRVTRIPATPVFAGERAQFRYVIHNPSHVIRRNLFLDRKGAQTQRCYVSAQGHSTVNLEIQTTRRGELKPGPLLLYSSYPLGLFRTWSWLVFDEAVLVYPKPIAPTTVLAQAGDASGQRTQSVLDGDEFSGLRGYHPGDAPTRLDWKASARTGALYTKQFVRELGQTVWFDWQALPIQDAELRLSMLCYQIVEAHAQGLRYGLRLPSEEIPPHNTPAHYHRCLTTLARFPGGLHHAV